MLKSNPGPGVPLVPSRREIPHGRQLSPVSACRIASRMTRQKLLLEEMAWPEVERAIDSGFTPVVAAALRDTP